jgi:hypothetical protein
VPTTSMYACRLYVHEGKSTRSRPAMNKSNRPRGPNSAALGSLCRTSRYCFFRPVARVYVHPVVPLVQVQQAGARHCRRPPSSAPTCWTAVHTTGPFLVGEPAAAGCSSGLAAVGETPGPVPRSESWIVAITHAQRKSRRTAWQRDRQQRYSMHLMNPVGPYFTSRFAVRVHTRKGAVELGPQCRVSSGPVLVGRKNRRVDSILAATSFT